MQPRRAGGVLWTHLHSVHQAAVTACALSSLLRTNVAPFCILLEFRKLKFQQSGVTGRQGGKNRVSVEVLTAFLVGMNGVSVRVLLLFSYANLHGTQ